jgi:cytochrome c-type biogenesis protein CcmH
MAAAYRRRCASRTQTFLMVIFTAIVFASLACGSPERSLEERANALDKKLMCPICPGETIDQSQVQIAKDMRQIVRDRLAAGESEAEISDYFVDRFGVQVLASPPASGFNTLVWIVPPVVLGISLAALYLILRDMRRGKVASAQTAPAMEDPSMSEYLAAVDAELLRSPAAGSAGSGTDSSPHVRRDSETDEVQDR